MEEAVLPNEANRKRAKAMRNLFTRKVMNYNRYHTGAAGEMCISPFATASSLLEARGFKRAPGTISAKNHCADYLDEIEAHQKTKPKQKKSKLKKLANDIANADKSKTPKTQKAPKVKGAKDVYIASDEFLSSFEWRRVRMQALKLYGPRCMCCGATPADGAVMNVDHIKPRKLFPSQALDLSNLQILCHECNHGKGNWDMTDWRQNKNPTNGACQS